MRGRLGQQARAWLILGRVSNLPTVWTNVLAAWVLAGEAGSLSSGAFAWMLLGASLLYVGGTTLNDFFDVAFDEEYRRERPIPSRVLSRTTVGVGSVLYFIGGSLAVVLGAKGSWVLLLCLVASIIFYDYRHKQWVGSVAVMGACRLFLSLLAASCVVSSLSLPAPVWMHAISLFSYIVGLTLAARGESRHASPEGWHSVFLGVPLILVCFAGPPMVMGTPTLLWLLGGFVFGVLIRSLVLLAKRDDPARIGKAVGLMLAGICLLDACFLADYGLILALWPVLGFALARALQRWVPAT